MEKGSCSKENSEIELALVPSNSNDVIVNITSGTEEDPELDDDELVPILSDDVIRSERVFVEDPFEGEFDDEEWVFVEDPFEGEFHDKDWEFVMKEDAHWSCTNGHHSNRVWNLSKPRTTMTALAFVGTILFASETVSASEKPASEKPAYELKFPGKVKRSLVIPILVCFAVVFLVHRELPKGSIKARKVVAAVLNAFLIGIFFGIFSLFVPFMIYLAPVFAVAYLLLVLVRRASN